MSDDALLAAVALALTGERPVVMAGGAATPDEVVARLADLGWDAPRLVGLRLQRQADEQPWPFEVPRAVLAQVGFARFAAVLKEVRRLTGTDGLMRTRHVGPKVIGPAEQRLLADRPPHHGNVG